jgi:hypothetical protein
MDDSNTAFQITTALSSLRGMCSSPSRTYNKRELCVCVALSRSQSVTTLLLVGQCAKMRASARLVVGGLLLTAVLNLQESNARVLEASTRERVLAGRTAGFLCSQVVAAGFRPVPAADQRGYALDGGISAYLLHVRMLGGSKW